MERKSEAESEGMNRECEGFGVRTTVNPEGASIGFENEGPSVSFREVDEVCLTDGSTVKII